MCSSIVIAENEVILKLSKQATPESCLHFGWARINHHLPPTTVLPLGSDYTPPLSATEGDN